jgi:hypothetical protein
MTKYFAIINFRDKTRFVTSCISVLEIQFVGNKGLLLVSIEDSDAISYRFSALVVIVPRNGSINRLIMNL